MTEAPDPSPPPYDTLDRAFDRVIERLRAAPGPITVLFSGGVDSSMVASAFAGCAGLELLTVGTRSSRDLESGRTAAELLGLSWRGEIVDHEDIERALQACEDLLTGAGAPQRAVAVSFAVALERTAPSRVVTAQGVDELFGGYAHVQGLSGPALERRYREDLALLLDREWPRAQSVAERYHRELLAPFLDAELRSACEAIPLGERTRGSEVKGWFREWCVHRGLARELARRPKRAFQYGSGIDRALKAR